MSNCCDKCGKANSTFVCARCKKVCYCSKSCQLGKWPEHKKQCTGPIPKMEPYFYEIRDTENSGFHVDDMKNGPDEPLEPPEEYENAAWWDERDFVLNGKVVASGSFYPKKMKQLIIKGIKEKRLTWEYVFSDNFMNSAVSAAMPVDILCMLVEHCMIGRDNKPRMDNMVQNEMALFWEHLAQPGHGDALSYKKEAREVLLRNKIELPITLVGHTCDELRQFTHAGRDKDCGCYMCVAAPFREAKKEELWEAMRRKELKRGNFMASWAAVKEFERLDFVPPVVDTSSKEAYKSWTHGPDEGKTVQTITKAEITEICRFLDTAYRIKRPLTHEELDIIVTKACEKRVPQSIRDGIEAAKRSAIAAAVAAKRQREAGVSSSTSGTSNSSNCDGSGTANTAVDTISTGAASLSLGMSETDGATAATPVLSTAAASKADKHTKAKVTITNTSRSAASVSDARHDEAKSSGRQQEIGGVAAQPADPTWLTDCVDPEYNLAKYRPKRASTQKQVFYAYEDSASENCTPEDVAATTANKRTSKRSNKDACSDGSGDGSDWAAEEDEEEGSGDEQSTNFDTSEDDGEGSDGTEDSDCGEHKAASRRNSSSRQRGAAKPKGERKARSAGSGAAKGSSGVGESGRMVWTDALDNKLRDAVNMIGFGTALKDKGWPKIAECMGHGFTGQQCADRWRRHLDPALELLRRGEWDDEEIDKLRSLVVANATTGKEGKVNWRVIATEMNREYLDCKNKWAAVLALTMKTGPFTPEEDTIIIQRVKEWAGKKGVFVALGEELNRQGICIAQRWRKTLSKRVESK